MSLNSGEDLINPPRFWNPKSKNGQKRRYAIAGLINIGISNSLLQLLLSSQLMSIGSAAILSQACNGALGFILYGKIVFNVKKLSFPQFVLRYSSMVALLWLYNWGGIELLIRTGISASSSALLMIMPLAATSYVLQKFLVFGVKNSLGKKKSNKRQKFSTTRAKKLIN